jgi:hypothetical protein
MLWLSGGIVGVAVLTGCTKGPSAKAINGTVACGGEKVITGRVTFVPVDGVGRTCAASIVGGQYRIDADGGVPLGKYRVEVDAKKKTGRKIQGSNGIEKTMIDEEIRVGPAAYAGDKSPLTTEIRSDSDAIYDIAIPNR